MSASSLLRCNADVARLVDVRAFVRRAVRSFGVGETAVADVVQAVDEWVTNIAVHGYHGAGGPVEVEIERDASGITVRVRDRAPAFDPTTAPSFDPMIPLERRRPGGMGIHLIRTVSDHFAHRALTEGGNEVTMHVAIGPQGGDA